MYSMVFNLWLICSLLALCMSTTVTDIDNDTIMPLDVMDLGNAIKEAQRIMEESVYRADSSEITGTDDQNTKMYQT